MTSENMVDAVSCIWQQTDIHDYMELVYRYYTVLQGKRKKKPGKASFLEGWNMKNGYIAICYGHIV
ncbi:MAG: hypothetical protein K6C05_07655 [Anaerovibrio sp.]|uniref:hypothetical protein n=1 Tax=Anaerovibrio sp. TaxID=1872532 RepID=UPI0025FF3102|nr:hypothetical protein [Anaerovibrio sp.]MCR5176714.1 hypothetical protein [Anaerovibrio sp.]